MIILNMWKNKNMFLTTSQYIYIYRKCVTDKRTTTKKYSIDIIGFDHGNTVELIGQKWCVFWMAIIPQRWQLKEPQLEVGLWIPWLLWLLWLKDVEGSSRSKYYERYLYLEYLGVINQFGYLGGPILEDRFWAIPACWICMVCQRCNRQINWI